MFTPGAIALLFRVPCKNTSILTLMLEVWICPYIYASTVGLMTVEMANREPL